MNGITLKEIALVVASLLALLFGSLAIIVATFHALQSINGAG